MAHQQKKAILELIKEDDQSSIKLDAQSVNQWRHELLSIWRYGN